MFEAQVIIPDGEGSPVVLSPWFPRRGDLAIFTLEVAAIVSGTSMTVEVMTKNIEDPGDGATVAGDITRSSVGRSSSTFGPSTLKELVRYLYSFDYGELTAPPVVFRMLPPVWFDSLKA